MDRQTIVEAMVKQEILKANLKNGPSAVVIQRDRRRPTVIIIRADGENFVAEVPSFFSKTKIDVTRAELENWGEPEKE